MRVVRGMGRALRARVLWSAPGQSFHAASHSRAASANAGSWRTISRNNSRWAASPRWSFGSWASARCRALRGSTASGPSADVMETRKRPMRWFGRPEPSGFCHRDTSNRVPPGKPSGLSVSNTMRRSWLRRPLVKPECQPSLLRTPSMALVGWAPSGQASAMARRNTTLLVVPLNDVEPASGLPSSDSGEASTVNSHRLKPPSPSMPGPLKGRLASLRASTLNPVTWVLVTSTHRLTTEKLWTSPPPRKARSSCFSNFIGCECHSCAFRGCHDPTAAAVSRSHHSSRASGSFMDARTLSSTARAAASTAALFCDCSGDGISMRGSSSWLSNA